ncbi:hypothetical protein ACLMJK_001155 [Lecanora helva]
MSVEPMSKILLERNVSVSPKEIRLGQPAYALFRDIAKNHQPLPYISEFKALGYVTPKALIITCVDPRNVPEKYLGLGATDASVIKNVCGHVGLAMNSILALDHLLKFEELMIIHHTDCGALLFTDADVRATVQARVPGNNSIDSMEFGGITEVAQSVKDDLAVLGKSSLIRKELKERASGYVFDIKTGLLTAVKS